VTEEEQREVQDVGAMVMQMTVDELREYAELLLQLGIESVEKAVEAYEAKLAPHIERLELELAIQAMVIESLAEQSVEFAGDPVARARADAIEELHGIAAAAGAVRDLHHTILKDTLE